MTAPRQMHLGALFFGVGLLSTFLGNTDLSKYPVDDTFPQDLPVTEGWQSRQELRGLFRTEYSGQTLCEHLGLPRPAHPAAAAQAARETVTT